MEKRMSSEIITNKKIKEKCQIFTPVSTVTYILDMAGYKEKIYGKKVLEPSCGSGRFLLQIVQRYIEDGLKNYSKKEIKSGLENDIYGFDIDSSCVKECRQNLNALAAKYDILNVQWNIFDQDYLSTKLTNSFDYIFGNPPYISSPDLPVIIKADIKTRFETCKQGKFDYSYAFVEMAYDQLAKEGILAFLIPSSIFKKRYANNLRNLIKQELITVHEFNNGEIFNGVLVAPAIIMLQKGKNTSSLRYIYGEDTINVNKNVLIEKWNFRTQVGERECVGNYFKVSCAVATLLNKAFLLREGTFRENSFFVGATEFEKALIKRAVCPKNKRYQRYSEHIIFPYWYDGEKIIKYTEQDFIRLFPNTYHYMYRYYNELMNRKSDKSAKWFEYGRSQALQYLNQKKILISSIISDCTQAYMLDQDEIPYSGLFIIQRGALTLEDLLIQLNSERFKRYIKNVGISVNGNSRRISPKDIENFPLEY